MTLVLTDHNPFAQGGNRLCFVHPEDSLRCIKVRRPDFTLEDRRREKGFPKNLKPLSSFEAVETRDSAVDHGGSRQGEAGASNHHLEWYDSQFSIVELEKGVMANGTQSMESGWNLRSRPRGGTWMKKSRG